MIVNWPCRSKLWLTAAASLIIFISWDASHRVEAKPIKGKKEVDSILEKYFLIYFFFLLALRVWRR